MFKELKEVLYKDLYRYYGKCDINTFLKSFLLNPAFKYTCILRVVQFYREKGCKFISIIFHLKLKILERKYAIQIPSNVKIGWGLYIGHFGRIIINSHAVIGDNVNLSTGITIGQVNRGSKVGSPIIGNGVWIGTNAVIVGKICVGNNVLIAPNAFVNFDVPDNSIVIGNPGEIHHNFNATQGYINFKV